MPVVPSAAAPPPSAVLWSPRDFFVRLSDEGVAACSAADLDTLCRASLLVLKDPKPLKTVAAPCFVIGDLNGDFVALQALLSYFTDGATNAVFLGNYLGGKGSRSLSSVCFVLTLMTFNSDKFVLLRGPRDNEALALQSNLQEELVQLFGKDDAAKLFKKFVDVFVALPLAAIVGDKVFCSHGGVSRRLPDRKELEAISLPLPVLKNDLVADLVTSEPWNSLATFSRHPDRDIMVFGEKQVNQAISRLGVEMIIRGGVGEITKGFATFANGKMVTVESNLSKSTVAMVFINDSKWSLKLIEKQSEANGRITLLKYTSDNYDLGSEVKFEYEDEEQSRIEATEKSERTEKTERSREESMKSKKND